eukprot:1150974-Pelagomonas_calceolata.AAC.1
MIIGSRWSLDIVIIALAAKERETRREERRDCMHPPELEAGKTGESRPEHSLQNRCCHTSRGKLLCKLNYSTSK